MTLAGLAGTSAMIAVVAILVIEKPPRFKALMENLTGRPTLPAGRSLTEKLVKVGWLLTSAACTSTIVASAGPPSLRIE